MKNIVLIIIAFAMLYTLQSQDKIDPIKIFDKNTVNYVNLDTNSFQIGWNWGSVGRKLDEALFINSYHHMPEEFVNNNYKFFSNTGSNMNVMEWMADPNYLKGGYYQAITGRVDTLMLNGLSMHIDPTIAVETTNSFRPRWNDKFGSVFGFQYHNFAVGDTFSSGANKNRFVLNKDCIYTASAVVLRNLWDGKRFFYEGYDATNHDTIILGNRIQNLNSITDVKYFQPYNGTQWYVSINLKAEVPSQLSQHLNDTILAIRLPYRLKHIDTTNNNTVSYTYSQIKFEQMPSNTDPPNDLDTTAIIGNFNNDYRGTHRNMVNITDLQDTIFFITGRMLMSNFTKSNYSVTLSAFFKNNGYINPGTLDYDNNPRFWNEEWNNTFKTNVHYIDSIDVEVTYYGKVSVAIQHIRFDTPVSRDIMFGKRDSIFNQSLAWTKTKYLKANNGKNAKIFRFYGFDELLPLQWGAARYFNMLVDTLATSEIALSYNIAGNINPPIHYKYATGIKEFWAGTSTTTSMSRHNSAPYYRYAIEHLGIGQDSSTFHLLRGFKGHKLRIPNSSTIEYENIDTLNSGYESKLYGQDTIFQNFNYSLFEKTFDNINYTFSPLFQYEFDLYKSYYKNSIFLYSKWWSNIWLESLWNFKSIDTTYNLIIRPKTGQEINLSTFSQIIFGAKGIFYWLKTSAEARSSQTPNELQLSMAPKLKINIYEDYLPSKYNLMISDSLGGDYIKFPYDQFFYNKLKVNLLDLNTLGVTSDRLYIGLKSMRSEVWKINTFINYCGGELMHLELQSWFGKGYTKMYTQKPGLAQDSIMKDFISLDRIKTRPLNRIKNNLPFFEQESSIDSGFYDLTLLKVDTLENMANNFYLGVQNRRTDPLVFEKNNPNNPNSQDSSMQFYSTAEFDSAVKVTTIYPNIYGIPKNALNWRNLFWKRLGCRELTIPFTPNVEGTYFIARELGVGTSYFNSDTCFFTDPKYYHKIDTTLPSNGSLIAKLLPGQGKIIKFVKHNMLDELCPNITCDELTSNLQLFLERNSFSLPNTCCYNLNIANSTNCILDNLYIEIEVNSFCSEYLLSHFANSQGTELIEPPSNNKIKLRIQNIVPFGIKTIGSFCVNEFCDFCLEGKVGKLINNTPILCENKIAVCDLCTRLSYSTSECCNTLEVYSTTIFDTKTQKNDYNIYAKQNDTTKGKISKIITAKKNNGKVIEKVEKNKNDKHIDLSIDKKAAKTKISNSNGRDTVTVYFYDENDSLLCAKDLILEEVQKNDPKSPSFEEPTESNTTDLSIQYFPNPVEELLNIEVNSDICKKVKVKLLTLKSEELFNKEVKTNALNQFSTEGISNGVYFLKIEDCESDKFIIKKIVIKK
jgi:hypothetical protein